MAFRIKTRASARPPDQVGSRKRAVVSNPFGANLRLPRAAEKQDVAVWIFDLETTQTVVRIL